MTELTWDGKYKDGKKTSPVKIALPFQTIESVNESSQQRQQTLDLYSNGKPSEWRNRLIWGDKRYVLPSLLPEFAGKVNLIYIDPPFNVGADFSFKATIPDNPDTDEEETTEFIKQPSIIEQKAYRDTWGKGLDSYLQWFYEAVIALRELLVENGSLYVHLDWRLSHYAKNVLDEIFGYENFVNEIIWKRRTNTVKAVTNSFSVNNDSIMFYVKSQEYKFNIQYGDYPPEYFERFKYEDKYGKYRWQVMATYSDERMKKLKRENKVRFSEGSKYPEFKQYIHELKGRPIENIWADINMINAMGNERVGYPTQKPEALIERIIKASSDENDLVLDCFIGSGTTIAVAEKLNRRWIGCDLGRFAIHTTRKRLLGIENIKPFIVQNLGKYERQQWVKAEFENPEARINQEKAYHNFILELYRAQPLNGHIWLHGSKAGRIVHIGSVEAPVSVGDVKNIIQEFWKIVGKSKDVKVNGIDILGWDFAFEINETAKQYAASNNIDVRFKKIPREVLEKKAVDQGDIQFFELASLDIKTKIEKKKLTLTLNDFIIPSDDIPEEVRKSITHWSQCIDYWAIDWNYKDDTFHNEWQSYRTKKNPQIELSVSKFCEQIEKFTVLVKVIDLLGNDTTKAISVNIK